MKPLAQPFGKSRNWIRAPLSLFRTEQREPHRTPTLLATIGECPGASGEGHMRVVIVSLAICALSTVIVGIVIADAVSLPMHQPAPVAQESGGWTTVVFKNPH
jgi:hypothetical protein